MDLNTRKILSLFASILFTIPVYIILHEGGHALIALSCGARITEFSILGAYMRYGGGTFTALTLSLFYIAGMLLPVLISHRLYAALSGRSAVRLLSNFFFSVSLDPHSPCPGMGDRPPPVSFRSGTPRG